VSEPAPLLGHLVEPRMHHAEPASGLYWPEAHHPDVLEKQA